MEKAWNRGILKGVDVKMGKFLFNYNIDNLEFKSYNINIIKKAMMVRSTYYSYYREKMVGENLCIENMEAALKLWKERE